MSMKAQVQTQAKTPATTATAHIIQPPVAVPEREVDRPDIATQLEGAARLGHRLGAISVRSSAPPIVRRQELPEEQEEEELQMKPQRAAFQRQGRGEGFRLDDETAGRIDRVRGSGQPLDGAIQAQTSETMGHDFSGVRVHTDSEADALNRQLSAKAFTTGQDIFFRGGEYNPGSSGGRQLLTHELAHVVQQSQGRVKPTMQLNDGVPVNDDQRLEHEADAMGAKALQTRRADHATFAPISRAAAQIVASVHGEGEKSTGPNIAQFNGDTEPPQGFFLAQPHSGELAAFCGYYAMCHYKGHELDLDDFRNRVYTQYRDMEVPENQIPQLVAEMGTGMEGIAVGQYGYTESSDAAPGIANGRFMAATNRYGGHWLTYIRDDSGQWWEYDSWRSGPTLVGTESQLVKQLRTDQMSNIYY